MVAGDRKDIFSERHEVDLAPRIFCLHPIEDLCELVALGVLFVFPGADDVEALLAVVLALGLLDGLVGAHVLEDCRMAAGHLVRALVLGDRLVVRRVAQDRCFKVPLVRVRPEDDVFVRGPHVRQPEELPLEDLAAFLVPYLKHVLAALVALKRHRVFYSQYDSDQLKAGVQERHLLQRVKLIEFDLYGDFLKEFVG